MKKYNLYYRAGNEIIDKKNISKAEVYKILASLKEHPESELRVTEIKSKDDEVR
jgi:hypothetical protein